MSELSALGEYNWSTFDRINEIPLMIASRALELTGRFLADASAVADYIAEAELHRYKDAASELDFVSLVINRGTPNSMTMVGDSDGFLELTTRKGGRDYTIKAEVLFNGPVASPVIEFFRNGKGKSYDCQLEVDNTYSDQDTCICWDIATVVTAATTDLKYRIINGSWPQKI